MIENWKEKLSPEDYQRFFGNEGVWRNDFHPEEHGTHPTVSTVVCCSGDEVLQRTDNYYTKIIHVRYHHGKGFMALVDSYCRFSSGTSDVVGGTSQESYDKALSLGIEMMNRIQKELDEAMEKYK